MGQNFLASILSTTLLLSVSIFSDEYKNVVREVALVSIPPAAIVYLFCRNDSENVSTSIKASLATMIILGASYYTVKTFFRDSDKEEKSEFKKKNVKNNLNFQVLV